MPSKLSQRLRFFSAANYFFSKPTSFLSNKIKVYQIGHGGKIAHLRFAGNLKLIDKNVNVSKQQLDLIN